MKLSATLAGVHQELAIGRPTVQIRWTLRSDAHGLAALDGNSVYDRRAFIFLAMVADRDHRTVKREHVVVVVPGRKAGVDDRRRPALQVEAV